MAKLIVDNITYDELAARNLYEYEFEKLLSNKTSMVFPGFHFVPFKELVYWNGEAKRPDFALIDYQYRTWWIGEVELLHHDLEGHVLKQVGVFLNGDYTSDHAEALQKKNTLLDLKRLEVLIQSQNHNVLVVVNRFSEEWKTKINTAGAELAIFEIFLSGTNNFIYRINGFQPRHEENFLSYCQLDKLIPRYLKVQTPSSVEWVVGQTIAIHSEDGISNWSVIQTSDAVYLAPKQSISLAFNKKYALVKDVAGNLRLTVVQTSPTRRRRIN